MGIIVFYSRNKAYVHGYELSFNRGDIHSLDFELSSDEIVFLDVGNSCC